MRILICGIMPAQAYSGGRYHAWMMAEAFAALGHEVTFWTNNKPIFLDDFIDFAAHDHIRLILTSDFAEAPGENWDFVWLIPHKNPPHHVFRRALEIAHDTNAKLGLLNFETPNWIEKTTPIDPDAWRAWTIVAPFVDLILASTNEGLKHAQEYFRATTPATHYAYCNPPINDRVADSIPMADEKSARKSVVCITRFGNSHGHKGGREILDFVGDELAGCSLTFIVGTKNIPEHDRRDYLAWGGRHDVEVKFQHRATDAEKFQLLKQADLMIFLSRFEGFGYPPVEAIYCGLPCIVYDLPVLREVSGDALSYVPLSKPEALSAHIADSLQNLDAHKQRLATLDRHRFTFDAYKEHLAKILSEKPPGVSILASVVAEKVDAAISLLSQLDAAHASRLVRKTTVAPKAQTIKSRIALSLVSALAKLFASISPLRRIVAHALFHPKNLQRILDDKQTSSHLFTDAKPLSRLIRQNRSFLKHVMLSREGIELLPEVITHENAQSALRETTETPEIIRSVKHGDECAPNGENSRQTMRGDFRGTRNRDT